MSKAKVQKTGWVIVNRKRNSIWKQPYISRSDADRELKAQIALIQKVRPTFKGEDWKIESFEHWETEGNDDFKEFTKPLDIDKGLT